MTSNGPDHTSLRHSLLGPSLLKAGQDQVDQQKVGEIIYNASKGSKFFKHEEKRDEQVCLSRTGENGISFFFLFFRSSYPAAQKEGKKKHIDKEKKHLVTIKKNYTAYEANRNYFKAKKGAGSARFDGRAEENR